MSFATKIGQIQYPVADVNRSRDFFVGVIGARLLFEYPGMAFVSLGETRLMLVAADGNEVGRNNALYFKVHDLKLAVLRLEEQGIAIEQPPAEIARLDDHRLLMAFFRDPDDNLLAYMAEVPLDYSL